MYFKQFCRLLIIESQSAKSDIFTEDTKHVIYVINFFRLVIETLEKQDRDKRCFRLVGGVLVERKVGEVEPALVSNRDKVHAY